MTASAFQQWNFVNESISPKQFPEEKTHKYVK